MKTLFTCLCAFLVTIAATDAQTYNFTALTGTYTPIVGGTIANLQADGSGYDIHDEGIANGIPIGFNFIYDGVSYSSISANSNGFASFKTIPVITNTRDYYYYTADLTQGPYSETNIRPILAPLWDDLDLYSQLGIKYITTGTAPFRVFTLEWNDVYYDTWATQIGISFQIKLYESTNIIEFHYLQQPGAVSVQAAASIGITGSEIGVGNFLSLNNASSSPTASFTVDTYTINTKPATNQIYRFSPGNNDPTLAPIANKTVNELDLLSFTASGTDPDVPGQTLSYSLADEPEGATIDPVTGIFNWTPTEAQGAGTYNIKVRVSDNGTPILFDEQPVTITVNEVNVAPELAVITNKTVNELTAVAFTAAATDADLPAQALTYSLVGAPAGATINPTTGVFNWTPTEAQGSNSYTFSVRVSDNASSALSAEQSLTITVNEVNAAPVLAAITNKTVNELAALTFTASATDADLPAQALTYSLVGAPAGATIDPTTGVFNWTPTEAQGPNSYSFNVRVTDNASPSLSAEQPVSITVNEANAAPVLAAITNKTVNELAPVTFTASATDADLPAQALTYSLVGAPAGASVNPTTGVFNWTPTEAQGPNNYSFNVRVSDNGSSALFAEQPVTITVNEVNVAPVLAAISNKTVNELTVVTFTAAATDADLPAQALTYTLVGAPAGATINPTTGVFTWTPTEAQGPNAYTFSVRVSDNATPALSDEQSLTITVHERNAAPVLAAIGNKTVNELTALTFTASATDADVPAQVLTYSLVGAPAGATIDPTTGIFNWTPTEAQGPNSYSFSVRVSDNASPALSAEQAITIAVNEVNAAPVLAAIGNKTVNELTALTFTASATDADLPAQPLTYSLVGAPAGANINATSGVFSWTPTEAQGGTVTFKVRVTDNAGSPLFAEQPVTITVNEVNVAPVLAAITNKTVNELTAVTFTASATDADLPAQALTYSLIGAPAGASINPTTGVFTWTPTEAQGPNTYTFSVRVADNASPALAAEQSLTIIVNEGNAAPVLAAIANKTVNELTAVTFTASATDADLPVQALTYSLVGGPAGASINPTTGVFNWTPTEAQGTGTYTFNVRVTDNAIAALAAEQPVTITVNEVNVAPALTAIGTKTVNELSPLTFAANATDADLPAQPLTYSLVGAPAGASINPTTGVFNWTPTEAQGQGTYTFSVRVTDNATPALAAEQSVTVTVNEVNAAPVLAAIGNQTVNALSTLAFTAVATDPDLPAQSLTYSLTGTVPAGASINPTTGAFTWTPTAAQGPAVYTFSVRATDNATPSLFAEAQIIVTVLAAPIDNRAPVLATIGNKTINELSLLTFIATATDPDLPAQALTYSLVDAPAGATINPTTGVFNWTPTEAQGQGIYAFKVRVVDNGSPLMATEQQIMVTVNEVNIAPVLAVIGNKTVNELAALTFTASATDADLPAQALTYSLVGAPAGATIDPTTGVFNWTPTEAQGPNSYSFNVRVTDNASPSLSAEQPVSITVNEANAAPVLAAITNKTVNELAPVTFTASATDADLPAQALTYSLVGAPAGASVNPTTGVFNWTPTEAQGPNNYSFNVRVSDNGSSALFAEQPVTITVNEVNVAPVLAAISNKTVNELTVVTFTAAATDADLPAQALTYTLVGAPAGATINPTTGVFTWTPTEAQGPNAYTFSVRVSDNATPALSDEQSLTITVHERNAAPVLAAIGNKTVNELTALTFTASATDADVPAQVLTYSLVGAPAGATIDPTTGIFNWTPTEAQGPNSYSFSVRVSDNASPALSAEQAITIAVNEVNAAPVLAAIGNKTVNELTALTFTASATDADLPAQPLTYSLVGAPAGANINATSGVFSWTPTEAQGGTVTFKVRVTDNAGSPLFAEQPVTITVNEVNVAPVLAAITNKTVNELTAVTFTASATDADLPAQALTYSLIGAPAGASINPTTGVFTWTPTEAQGPNTYTFSVRVADNASPALAAEQSLTIIVNEGNAAPVLAAIANKTVNELTAVTFTASATDADLPVQALTYSLVGGPAGASINPTTGVFNWTPTEAQGTGTYTFNVRVTDNAIAALAAEQPVTITVNEVNVAPALTAIGTKTVNELSPLTFAANATDADLPAQPLTYSLVGAPAGASINPTTGVFNWTPTEAQGQGTYTFSVRVTDNATPALAAEQSVTVTVNEVNAAPVLAAIGNQTVNALSTLAFTAVATDPDLPAQSLTYSLTGTVPAGASINPTTGAFTWTPTTAQGVANYTFGIRVTDNGTPTSFVEQMITVSVLGVSSTNVAPVLAAIGNKTVNELSHFTFTAKASDANIPAQKLTFSLEGAVPSGASIDKKTGVFKWTPSEIQGPKVYSFRVRVTDNGSPAKFAEETITVTVNEVIEVTKSITKKFKLKCRPVRCVTLSALTHGLTHGLTRPFTYSWSTGATTPSIIVCPTNDVTYRLTIKGLYQIRQTDFIVSVKEEECRKKPKKIKEKKNHPNADTKKGGNGKKSAVDIESNSNKDAITKISLYPNPSLNKRFHLSIKDNGLSFEAAQLFITDVLGRKVYAEKMLSNEMDIELFNQPQGIYLVHVLVNQKETIIKLLLQ